ncbi:MAG TPA: DUF2007 domain-containing protein [Bacteroidales bacterium]|nr:DUF2007 domain-containing protein [Bacteroidales bacterium]HPS15665.1 DUF2007 domain-containing protein [Bacteroidales bacterium]
MNWVCIYSSAVIHKAEIVQAVLLDNNIDSVIVNKQDSAYHIGDIEVHVHPNDVILAKQIIIKNKL